MPLFGRQKPGFGIEYQSEDNVTDVPEENPPSCVGDILAGYIRQNSRCRVLTGVKDLMSQDSYMPRYMRQMGESAACKDICTIEGEQDIYLYSSNEMSQFFAMITMLTMEKNYPRIIAEMVRYNCKVYPASTPEHYFEQSPYRLSVELIKSTVEQMKRLPEYMDIRTTTSGDGTPYLYSSDYFTEEYAKALADQIEEI